MREAFALKEVASQYERLLHGMQATLRELATSHVALAARMDASVTLQPGRSHAEAAAWVETALGGYTHALRHCRAVSAPPPITPAAAAAAAAAASVGGVMTDAMSDADADRLGGASPLSPAAVQKLREAVSVALGERPALSASTSARARGGASLAALAAASPTAAAAAAVDPRTSTTRRSRNRWAANAAAAAASAAGSGGDFSGDAASSFAAFERQPNASSMRDELSGAVAAIALSARKLRLRPAAALRVYGQGVKLRLTVLPASLRLPPLTTPAQALKSAELELGYDERLTFSTAGSAYEQLLGLLADVSPVSAYGPAPLLLQLEVLATAPSGVPRAVGGAVVPLAPMLQASSQASSSSALHTTRIVTLTTAEGTPIGDVAVSAAAPALLASLHRLQAAAPAVELTIHDLTMDPSLLLEAGAWGVWVQTDLLGLAPFAPEAAAQADLAGDGLLRTPANPFDPATGAVHYGHSSRVPVAAGSPAAARLVAAVAQPPTDCVTLELTVFCSGPRGATALGTGRLEVPVPAPALGSGTGGAAAAAAPPQPEMYLRTVALTSLASSSSSTLSGSAGKLGGAGEVEVGEVQLTLKCADALRAAAATLHTQPRLSFAVHSLQLAAAAQADVALAAVWIEAHLPAALADGPMVSERLYATRGELHPTLSLDTALGPSELHALGEALHHDGAPGTALMRRSAWRRSSPVPGRHSSSENADEAEAATSSGTAAADGASVSDRRARKAA